MRDFIFLIKFMIEDYKPSEETIKRHQEKERLKQKAYENMTIEERIQENRSERWLKEMCRKYFGSGEK